MKFKEHITQLPVYEAGKPIELVAREFGIKNKNIIKLASNENPLGTSKKVRKTLKKVAKNANLYPDDSYYELKDALANKFNVKSENIIIGSGSDQVIEFIMHAKVGEGMAILQAGITFAMYGIYASHVNAKVYKTKSSSHDLKELKELYEEHKDEIGIIFLCLPNNPLGECLDAKDVVEFIKSVDENTLVVLDCAYMEFASFKDSKKLINPADLIKNFKNVIYLGTFSKAYGLGGMRVGYGIANKNIISELHKLRPPFNITTPSLAGAISALKDDKFIKKTLKNNFEEMKKYENFARQNNIKFIPSYTNFITFFFDKEINSTQICDNLLKRGIILRNLKSYGLNAVRITIGTSKENKIVLKELKKEI